MKKLILFIQFFILISFVANADDDDGRFVLNTRKGVSSMAIRNMLDAWSVIRIDYPSARSVFMYDCNNVRFCLFDLMQDGKFLIFYSPTNSPSIKIKVDGKDHSENLQECFIKLSSLLAENANPDNKAIGYQSFGMLFNLAENQECELQFEGNFNFGKYLMRLKRENKGWWEGCASISHQLSQAPGKKEP